MAIGAWGTLLASCVAGGASLCAALVVPRRYIWMATVAGVASLLTIVASLAAVWHGAQRADAIVASAFIGLGTCLGGFALASSLLPSLTRRSSPAPLREPGRSDGLVHLILLADAEPEDYEPAAVSAAFADLDATDVPVPPDAARVLVYASERARYRQLGGSPARSTVRSLALATSMLIEGTEFALPVRFAFCDGGPSLAGECAEAIGAGAARIVVALLGVAESRAFALAARDAAPLVSARAGVDVVYTAPLWSATEVAELVARRVVESLDGSPGADDGVVLVSQGQPWQWDRAYPTASEHATYFCQRVRADLVTRGLREDRVRLAWLDWDEPGVTEVVRHLAALGCTRIRVVPATMPFDTVSTLLDLRDSADQAGVDAEVSIEVLSGWGDDHSVAQALRERILESAREGPGL